MPRPRSLPCARASARRRSKPARSDWVSAIVHAPLEVAAVVGEDEAGLERHRGGRDQVAAAQLDRVDPELARGHVDDALDRVGRLGAPGAAVRAGRRGVREHAGALDVDRGRGVDAGEAAHVVGRGARAARREIGADVHLERDAQAEEAAARVERQLGRGHVVAAVLVAEEALAAARRPLHRPARGASRPRAPAPAPGRCRCACRSCRRPRW